MLNGSHLRENLAAKREASITMCLLRRTNSVSHTVAKLYLYRSEVLTHCAGIVRAGRTSGEQDKTIPN